MAISRCRFCGVIDEVEHLFEVCTSSYLINCINVAQDYIEDKKQSDRDSISQSAVYCPICKEPFRVKVKWRWNKTRYCSYVSLNQYFNFVMIVCSTLGFFYAALHVFRSEEGVGKNARIMVWCMVSLIAGMGMIVIRTLYKRWERHQMDAEVEAV